MVVFDVRIVIRPNIHVENDIPLADFTERSIKETKQDMLKYIRDGLNEVSDEDLLKGFVIKHFIVRKENEDDH